RTVGLAHDPPSQRVVRYLMGDIRPGPVPVEPAVVRGDVDRPRAAVAGDDRRHALRQEVDVAARGRRQDGHVTVTVQVDEAGGDNQSHAVEDTGFTLELERADSGDALALDREIALDALAAAAV